MSFEKKILLQKKQKNRQERIINEVAAQAFKRNKKIDKETTPQRRNKGSNNSVFIQISSESSSVKRNRSSILNNIRSLSKR